MNKIIENNDQNRIKNALNESLKIITEFNWLLNLKVLDFYHKDHWSLLPISWTETFDHIEPAALSDLFAPSNRPKHVWPLSLLALRVSLQRVTIPRKNRRKPMKEEPLCLSHPKLKYIFRKHIKPKKLHEIREMSMVCARTAKKTNCKYILDFGAGLGHLSRILGYGYGLSVCCLEQQTKLSMQASSIDKNLETIAGKCLSREETATFRRPIHLNVTLTEGSNADDLLRDIIRAFNISHHQLEEDFQFGIVGLHPCGDLAAILMRFFLQCEKAKFLNIVGCCYMKLTTTSNGWQGYPLSSHLVNINHGDLNRNLEISPILTYEAREVACHAQEVFVQTLQNKDYGHLKIHSYRAAIEKIICRNWPHLQQSPFKSTKYSESLSFADYCRHSVAHLNLEISERDIRSTDTLSNLTNWRRIVIVLALRLLLAPLVESHILYDRLMWLLENDCQANIEAIFDPMISSRNQVLTAVKS